MTYIESKVLSNNDKIVKVVEKSKLQLVFAWIWGILGFFLLLIPTIRAIIKTIEFSHIEFVLTENKVIEKYGIFNVVVDEAAYNKIENITIRQSFWGKIFNYGNICIQGANNNNINFSYAKNPFEIKKMIQNYN